MGSSPKPYTSFRWYWVSVLGAYKSSVYTVELTLSNKSYTRESASELISVTIAWNKSQQVYNYKLVEGGRCSTDSPELGSRQPLLFSCFSLCPPPPHCAPPRNAPSVWRRGVSMWLFGRRLLDCATPTDVWKLSPLPHPLTSVCFQVSLCDLL